MSDDTSQNRRNRGRPKAWHDKTDQNTIKSLDRAMAVLDYLSKQPGVTLSQVAEDLDQSVATVYRVLVTLAGRGLAELDPETQHWHVGPDAFVIGARYLRRTSVAERARPILRNLMETTGETANLGAPRGPNVLFVGQVECHQPIRAFFPPGTLSPMHASGIGKALLANMPRVSSDRIIGSEELEKFTEYTLTHPEKLKRELEEIRQQGFSIDNEEKNAGMRCIAAPVFDWQGEVVAGLSVSGPTSRITPATISQLSDVVINATKSLSTALGADGATDIQSPKT